MSEPLQVIHPPKFVFEDDGLKIDSKETTNDSDNILAPNSYAVIPDDGGILMYTDGFKWPEKGWVFREAILATDTIKRAIMNSIRFTISIPRYIFQPSKLVRIGLEYFTDYTNIVYTRWGCYWKPQYYCTSVREIHRVGMEMAKDDETSIRLVKFICMLLEFDNAYRYRFQDMMEEIDVLFASIDPGSELIRVMEIARDRDPLGAYGTGDRFRSILKILPYAMKIKIIKNTLKEFFSKVDISKLWLDEVDWYRVLIWGDYDFRGISLDDRLIERAEIDLEWFKMMNEKKKEANKNEEKG